MKFVHVKVYGFHVFFTGDIAITVPLITTDDEVRAYLNRKYSGGNWNPNTLTCKVIKVKENKTNFTNIKE